jgi:uncharacterized protein (DUF2141 family)
VIRKYWHIGTIFFSMTPVMSLIKVSLAGDFLFMIKRFWFPGLMLAGLAATGLAAICLKGLPAQAGATGNLTVEVDNLTSQDGLVCLSLFSRSEGFPSNSSKAVANQCAAISSIPMKVQFTGLAQGSYAVAVLHDANSDRQLNRNGLGIPTEGFGFSRNPVIRTGPPSFNDAAFIMAGNDTSVQVELNYFF